MRHRWASFNTVLWSFVSFLVFFVLSIRNVGCFLLADGFYEIKWHSLVTNTKLFQPSPIHTNKWEDKTLKLFAIMDFNDVTWKQTIGS